MNNLDNFDRNELWQKSFESDDTSSDEELNYYNSKFNNSNTNNCLSYNPYNDDSNEYLLIATSAALPQNRNLSNLSNEYMQQQQQQVERPSALFDISKANVLCSKRCQSEQIPNYYSHLSSNYTEPHFIAKTYNDVLQNRKVCNL